MYTVILVQPGGGATVLLVGNGKLSLLLMLECDLAYNTVLLWLVNYLPARTVALA